jgi:hypothetical protein
MRFETISHLRILSMAAHDGQSVLINSAEFKGLMPTIQDAYSLR